MRASPRWAAVVVGALVLAVAWQSPRAATSVGDAAPSLVGAELNGATFDLGALRGRTVIVNFWATWCVPCRTEMPVLDQFYRQYHGQGLEMIAVSADRPRDRSDVVKAMQAFSYPAAMLKEMKVNGFGAPQALPVTYVVDGKGVLRAVMTPDRIEVTSQSLADIVLPLLNGAAFNRTPDTSPQVRSGQRRLPPVAMQTVSGPDR